MVHTLRARPMIYLVASVVVKRHLMMTCLAGENTARKNVDLPGCLSGHVESLVEGNETNKIGRSQLAASSLDSAR